MKTGILRRLSGLLSADDRRTVAREILRDSSFELAIVRTDSGRFAVDIADDVVSWCLIRNGYWEPFETAAIKALLRPGDTFVNVGANLGWYAVLADRATAPDGHVVAIEPDAHNLELLHINLELNDCARVVVEPYAVYDRPEVGFKRSRENFGDHQIVLDSKREASDTDVPVRRLDDLIDDAREVRLITIDAQGAEPGILRSGVRVLANTQYLITEFWPTGLRRLGETTDSLAAAIPPEFAYFAELEERPFSWTWSERAGLAAVFSRRDAELGPHASNYIFAREPVSFAP